MTKGRPFLEIFASAVHEDYRFPILEVFAFLYALGTFAAGLGRIFATSDETMVFSLISNLMSISLFIFLILIFKNVAYGLGGDLEKGTIQTLLSYPLKRRNILTAKLLSAIGVSFLLFFGIQLTALVIMAPSAVFSNIGIVLLTYAANFGYVLFLATIILLMTLFIKKGGIALIIGIVMYFAISIASGIMLFVAAITGSILPMQLIAMINPASALNAHYGILGLPIGLIRWAPTLTEASLFVLGNYVIIALLLFFAYIYFSRRLSI